MQRVRPHHEVLSGFRCRRQAARITVSASPAEKGVASMAVPSEPTGRPKRSAFRLTSGFDVFEEWSRNATQAARNIVNQVLFAIVEKSVFADYDVIDDAEKTMEFFVLARGEITVKVRVHGLDSFGIIYIGAAISAPGLDRAKPGLEPGAPKFVLDEPGSDHGTPHLS
jgi:hypothetical protein